MPIDEVTDTPEVTEEPGKIDFGKIFSSFVEAARREWKHDRSTTLGASEAFYCMRRLWLDKKGAEAGYVADIPDEDDDGGWGAAHRGNTIEKHFLVPAIAAHLPVGVDLHCSDDDQLTLVDGKNSATPDGVLANVPRDALSKYGISDLGEDNAVVLIEFKSIDPRVSLRNPKHNHVLQLQIQLALAQKNMDRLGISKPPKYGIILYVDASFFDRFKVFVVEYDPAVYKVAQERAATVFEADSPVELVPEGMIDDSCRFCKWVVECAKMRMDAIPDIVKSKEVPAPSIEDFEKLALEYDLAKEREATAEQEKKEIGLRIKNLMSGIEKRSAATDYASVSWVVMPGKKTTDTKAMIEAGVDLEPFQKVSPSYDVLRVTIK